MKVPEPVLGIEILKPVLGIEALELVLEVSPAQTLEMLGVHLF